MSTDNRFKLEYTEFMKNYIRLGHMRSLSDKELNAVNLQANYLLHNGIWQRSNNDDKLRVVFNASSPTTSGRSLNDTLLAGPKLQNDLAIVITRWRQYRVAFCADMKMMFRQIRINASDIHLQRILWSKSTEEPILHYALLTVTYGESCAPYLALRTLQQLCQVEGRDYPRAVEAINQELYVDDILSGADSEIEALQRRNELITLLKAGGFELKKWISNVPDLLKDIAVEDRLRPDWLTLDSEGPVNELGVAWDPLNDCFRFAPPQFGRQHHLTKRKVLSEMAQLFDPAGWLAPIVLIAKIFMQDLWREKVEWDEHLPKTLSRRWMDERMTIPRLELRAALLAAKLLTVASKALNIPSTQCFAWSDSQIVLKWLESEDPIGNQLVENYTSQILDILPSRAWTYVPSAENPADIATRGTLPAKLAQNQLWWIGPTWLGETTTRWPTFHPSEAQRNSDQEETNPPSTSQCLVIRDVATPELSPGFITRFSRLENLLRIVVRCLRLYCLCRHKPTPLPLAQIDAESYRVVYFKCVSWSQKRYFLKEINELRRNQPVSLKSPLRNLDPFLDSMGILRTGGRLRNAPLPHDEKHPVILDGRCHLASLIIGWAHERALHGGFRSTCAYASQRAWIIGGIPKVRSHLRRCLACAKIEARLLTQQMSALPPSRVTPSRPFNRCGVDYAGPFQVARSGGRGVATFKGYVALFVCLSTKALHLELVGDLTTASFIGALSRFIGRRGRPLEIWSDNATNFRGADLQLRKAFHDAGLDWTAISERMAIDNISWKFIPPSAPHFGELWEAGVKSMKSHLRRVAGTRRLTYEEFSTLLMEIEMVLNSRPLTPLSGDIDDLNVLTPAHFLVGGSLIDLPRPPLVNDHIEHLAHWKLVEGLRGQFWKRWSREYLNTLQQRTKWTRPRKNLAVGDLVMISDAALLRPNGQWPLGRVLEVHPGQDGLVRVVKIKTTSGEFTRPITKLVRLPLTPAEPEYNPPSSN